MSDHQASRARARAYGLLGRLLLKGLDPENLEAVQALPALAEDLPEDLDRLAAEHHRAFAMQAFPYEGVFRTPEALVGGAALDGVLRSYQAGGFGLRVPDASPDHIGVELAYLSHLSGAEADAQRDGAIEAVERCRALSRAFLDEHLGAWLLPWLSAVVEQPRSFWTGVAELAFELAARHRGELTPQAVSPVEETPERDSPLDDEATGLAAIADYLATPTRSGLLLTRYDLDRLARITDLPHGFGDRRQQLTALLQAAGQYDAVDRLVDGLDARLEAEAARLEHWAQPSDEALGRVATVWAMRWRGRIGASRALVARVATDVSRLASGRRQEPSVRV